MTEIQAQLYGMKKQGVLFRDVVVVSKKIGVSVRFQDTRLQRLGRLPNSCSPWFLPLIYWKQNDKFSLKNRENNRVGIQYGRHLLLIMFHGFSQRTHST